MSRYIINILIELVLKLKIKKLKMVSVHATVWFVSLIMDLSPENDGQGTWVWTLNYCHLLLNPFPSGPTPIFEMVVSRMRYMASQVLNKIRIVAFCQVSFSLLQNNKCWIISTNKTLFISISLIWIWFHN